MSARRVWTARSRVFVWQTVTVAPPFTSMNATGIPTTGDRPTTTASAPGIVDPRALEHLEGGVGRGRDEALVAQPEEPRVERVDPVDVLERIDDVDDGPQGDPGRERQLDDDPGDAPVVVEAPQRGGQLGGLGGRLIAGHVDEPALDPDRGAGLQDSLEVDHRRRAPPADDDGEPRRAAVRGDELGDVGGDPGPDLGGDRGAFEEARADAGLHGHATGADRRDRRRGASPLATTVVGRASTTRGSRPRSSSTRALVTSAQAGSPTAGRFTRTLAAAPSAAASVRRAATCRSDEALTLQRAASSSAAVTTSRQRLDAAQRDFGRDAGGITDRGRAGVLLLRRVAGQLHRRGEGAVGGRVLVGDPEEAIRELGPCGLRPRVDLGVHGVPRPTLREGGDHRHEAGGQAGRDGGRAATPGTGAAEASRSTKAPRVRSRNRVGSSCTPPIVGARGRPAAGRTARPRGRTGTRPGADNAGLVRVPARRPGAARPRRRRARERAHSNVRERASAADNAGLVDDWTPGMSDAGRRRYRPPPPRWSPTPARGGAIAGGHCPIPWESGIRPGNCFSRAASRRARRRQAKAEPSAASERTRGA